MKLTTRTADLRMSWDASVAVVGSTTAKQLGLIVFDLEERNHSTGEWEYLGAWATDDSGRFVSIPASE